MAINQLSNANTFGHMVTSVSALIAIANTLTDGPQLNCNTTLYITGAGVSLNVANTANIKTCSINVLTGNCVSQFDANGQAVIMALIFT